MIDRQDLEPTGDSLLRMTAEIVSAYVSNNTLLPQLIPEVIASVFTAISDLRGPRSSISSEPLKPAVPIRKSIMPDYLTCLEDGKHLKMLKRHLRAAYNMSPEEYRTRWNLPQDYPMVAPNYAKARSKFAKDIGLGRRTSVTRPAPEVSEVRAASGGGHVPSGETRAPLSETRAPLSETRAPSGEACTPSGEIHAPSCEVRAPSIEKSLTSKGKRPSSSAPSASHGDDSGGD